MDLEAYRAFTARIREYLLKAVREAKTNTSWVSPNTAYEEALLSFVDDILEEIPDSAFLRDFTRFQRLIAHYGHFTSLSQVLLKIASPGVPDFYQGSELWDFSLVDPDNRRPVDYDGRIRMLAELKRRETATGPLELIRELLQSWTDGRIKLYLIYCCLNYRRNNREVFDRGDYLPLEARGARARHVCAFSRNTDNSTVVAAAARFFATLAPERGTLPLGESAWGDTVLSLGATGSYRNIITGERVEADATGSVPLARLFGSLPLALLERTRDRGLGTGDR
jgi:(1->4)-alpha-D-glucan 1-alpha-D-glucosylmutase